MPPADPAQHRPPWVASVITAAAVTMVLGAFVLHRTFQDTSGSGALSFWSIALAGIWAGGAAILLLLTRSSTPIVAEPRFSRFGARRHPLVFAAVSGLVVAGASLLGALALREIPLFSADVAAAAGRVDEAPVIMFLVALVTGASEELFFRIGLHRVLPQRIAIVGSTALYGLLTLATENLPLVLAAVVLGASCALVLHVTARWYAPIIVHALWSVALVGVLPQL